MNNRLLKGNYKAKNKKTGRDKNNLKNMANIFENKATERLGGSIAFVMKSNKFIWGADEKAK